MDAVRLAVIEPRDVCRGGAVVVAKFGRHDRISGKQESNVGVPISGRALGLEVEVRVRVIGDVRAHEGVRLHAGEVVGIVQATNYDDVVCARIADGIIELLHAGHVEAPRARAAVHPHVAGHGVRLIIQLEHDFGIVLEHSRHLRPERNRVRVGHHLLARGLRRVALIGPVQIENHTHANLLRLRHHCLYERLVV